MTQYIDKEALVAEIEKTIDEPYPKHDQQCDWENGYCGGLCKALSIIEDTLEVKEVDLEEELGNWLGDRVGKWTGKECERMCLHFFELGVKAQQNISINVTDIDKVIEENGVDPNSKEAKMFRESYYMALEKLKTQKGE